MKVVRFGLVASLVLALGIAGCSSHPEPGMPNVVGQQLDSALTSIEQAGFTQVVDVEGGGLFGVVDKSNWKVCAQTPNPGSTMKAAPHLEVARSCTSEPSAEPTPSATSAATDSAATPIEGETTDSQAVDSKPVTPQSSAEFKSVLALTETCSPKIAAFAERYSGRLLAFDGGIVAMNRYRDNETRYNILINVGDFSATVAQPGPNFQFRNVNTTYDLKLSGSNIPDSIGVGTNLRIVAEVGSFEPQSCLFLLDPVSTQVR